MGECTQSLMDRKDKVICEQTLRILELEDELAFWTDTANYYEIGESRLVERCLKAEGREGSTDNYVSMLAFAHGGKKAEREALARAKAPAK